MHGPPTSTFAPQEVSGSATGRAPRHHRIAGWRVSCIGHRRPARGLALWRVCGEAVSPGFVSGHTHPSRTLPYGRWRRARGLCAAALRSSLGLTGRCIGCTVHALCRCTTSKSLCHRPLEGSGLASRRPGFESPTWRRRRQRGRDSEAPNRIEELLVALMQGGAEERGLSLARSSAAGGSHSPFGLRTRRSRQ